MASKRVEICQMFTIVLIFMNCLSAAATNVDCGGKPFHCVNSTHFMICVDLGSGVTKTVDDFVIQCPSTTSCQESNHFECEYHLWTTTEPLPTDPADTGPLPIPGDFTDSKSTIETWNDVTNSVFTFENSTGVLNEYYNTIDTSTNADDLLDIKTPQQTDFFDSEMITNTNNKTSMRNEHLNYLSTITDTKIKENFSYKNISDFPRTLVPLEYQNNYNLPFLTKLERDITDIKNTNNTDKTTDVNNSATFFTNQNDFLLHDTFKATKNKNAVTPVTKSEMTTDYVMVLKNSYPTSNSSKIENMSTLDFVGQTAKSEVPITTMPYELSHKTERMQKWNEIIPTTNSVEALSSTLETINTELATPSQGNLSNNYNGNVMTLFQFEKQSKTSPEERSTSTELNLIVFDSDFQNFVTVKSTIDYELPAENSLVTVSTNFISKGQTTEEVVIESTLLPPIIQKPIKPDTIILSTLMPTEINEYYDDYDTTTSNKNRIATPGANLVDQTKQYTISTTLSSFEEYLSNVTILEDHSTTNEDTGTTNLPSLLGFGMGVMYNKYLDSNTTEDIDNNIVTSSDVTETEMFLVQNDNSTESAQYVETTLKLFYTATNETEKNEIYPYDKNDSTYEIMAKFTTDDLLLREGNTLQEIPFTVTQNPYVKPSASIKNEFKLKEQVIDSSKIRTISPRGVLTTELPLANEISWKRSNTGSDAFNKTEFFMENLNIMITSSPPTESSLGAEATSETFDSISIDHTVSNTEQIVTTETDLKTVYGDDPLSYENSPKVKETALQWIPYMVSENPNFKGSSGIKNGFRQSKKSSTRSSRGQLTPQITSSVSLPTNNLNTGSHALDETKFFLPNVDVPISHLPSTLAPTVATIDNEQNTKPAIGGTIVNRSGLNRKEMFLFPYVDQIESSPGIVASSEMVNLIPLEYTVANTEKSATSATTQLDFITVYGDEQLSLKKKPIELRHEEYTQHNIFSTVTKSSYFDPTTSPQSQRTSEVISPTVEISTTMQNSLYPLDGTELFQPDSDFITSSPLTLAPTILTTEYMINTKDAIKGTIKTRKDLNGKEMLLQYENTTLKPTEYEVSSELLNTTGLRDDYSDLNPDKSSVNGIIPIIDNPTIKSDIMNLLKTNLSVSEDNEYLLSRPNNIKITSTLATFDSSISTGKSLLNNAINADGSVKSEDMPRTTSNTISETEIIQHGLMKEYIANNNDLNLAVQEYASIGSAASAYDYPNVATNTESNGIEVFSSTAGERVTSGISVENYVTTEHNEIYYIDQIATPKIDVVVTTENKQSLNNMTVSSVDQITTGPYTLNGYYAPRNDLENKTSIFTPNLFTVTSTHSHNQIATEKHYNLLNTEKNNSFVDIVTSQNASSTVVMSRNGTNYNFKNNSLNGDDIISVTTIVPTEDIRVFNEQPNGSIRFVNNVSVNESKNQIKVINDTEKQFNTHGSIVKTDSSLISTLENYNTWKKMGQNNNTTNNKFDTTNENRISNKRSVSINGNSSNIYIDRFTTNDYKGSEPVVDKVYLQDNIQNFMSTATSNINKNTPKFKNYARDVSYKNVENNSTRKLIHGNHQNDTTNSIKTEGIFGIQSQPSTIHTKNTNVKTTSDTTELSNNHTFRTKVNKISINMAPFTCINRFRGRYEDRYDCRKFYICIGKVQPVNGKCPANTVFSGIRKQCTKNLSHCMTNNQFHCITEGRFSDVFRNNIYYICVKSSYRYLRFQFQCQNGYHLNRTSIQCVLDKKPQSQISSTSVDSDSNKGSDQSTVEKKSKEKEQQKDEKKHICIEEGKFPKEDDCRKYYVCSKNSKSVFRRRTKKCDSDEVFHRERKKCVDTESYECK